MVGGHAVVGPAVTFFKAPDILVGVGALLIRGEMVGGHAIVGPVVILCNSAPDILVSVNVVVDPAGVLLFQNSSYFSRCWCGSQPLRLLILHDHFQLV